MVEGLGFRDFFFGGGMNEQCSKVVSLSLMRKQQLRYAYLKSPKTSCKCGTAPSSPLTDLFSSRDRACALAAAQDKRALQRRNHAAQALPRMGAGADLDFALATNLRKLRVSHDHLPPRKLKNLYRDDVALILFK